MDKLQIGCGIIAFAILMLISPWGLSKVPSIAANEYIGALSALVYFYAIVFVVVGIAVFYVKEEREEVVTVAK